MINSNIYRILLEDNSYRIFIFKDSKEAFNALEIFKYMKSRNKNFPNFYILSDFRAKKGEDLRSYSLEFGELTFNLYKFYSDKNSILLAPLHSILNPLPKMNLLEPIIIKNGEKVGFLKFENKLIDYGFDIVQVVYSLREISVHGDIIDIFSHNYDYPLRISFFDDEIESIRFFDTSTQMCIGDDLDEAVIFPALFSLTKYEYEILDKKSKDSNYDVFLRDIHSLGFWFIDGFILSKEYKSIITPNAKSELIEISTLESLKDDIEFDHFNDIEVLDYNPNYSDLLIDVNNVKNLFLIHKNRQKILFSMNSLILESLEIPAEVEIIQDSISINILTPTEIILSLNKPSKPKKQNNKTIILNELNNGDYVVHDNYGVGIFKGIKQNTVLGNTSDFIEIDYLNNDKLLLPTYNLNLISKYVANSSSIPMLDRLGKGSFAKIKQKVKPKLLQIAKEIISLAAERELIKGKVIDTNNLEYKIFKNSVDFSLTNDQERSINEILDELSSGKVMDRLLIGDVGFGKTEVAMNAIFCVIKSGYQALLIVPTTLLSSQHFKTLSKRFEPFNIKIVRLDRFIKDKQSVLDSLNIGDFDLAIGTHSLLNANFKNLGLIVLDEEHKFGVKQKEQIKNISKDVHILSMSATPIPRTLNMALSLIKTKSELNTPPSNRLAPKTFVKNYNTLIIKDAILRELNRRGQIFYIHNNISSIDGKKDEILKILPKLKIAILHSKISQIKSEDIMVKFANGDYDLLLSTSIVESGIHLPNANTIIVDGADRFGIADLHQLRGRIGRSDKEGYCYLLIDNRENITNEAKQRLLALETNSFLGVGGILSYNDLEIRGGGNILGEEQSGHIKNIGYSLYLKMLEESINEISGKNISNDYVVDIKLNISAFINPSIIPSDKIRIDLYRRLSNALTPNDVYLIEEEIIDRFGKLDSHTIKFLQLIMIKVLSKSLNIKTIMNYNQNITIIYLDSKKDNIKADEIDDSSILESVLVHLRNKIKIL